MTTIFKYKYNKRSKKHSAIALTAVVAIFVALLLFGGNFLMACITSIFVALVLLCLLSIPRKIKVSSDALEIQCVVELTRLEIGEIASIRRTCRREYDQLLILLGGFGLFGYYGFYLNPRRWDIIKVYATEWENLVEIEDIYEQKYIVSCRESEKLISLVNEAKERYQESVDMDLEYEEEWDY